MPKSITFFSRGKTPIYVNYVIAHNTQRAARYALRVSRSVVFILSLSRRAAASESEAACELQPAKMDYNAPFRALSRPSRFS